MNGVRIAVVTVCRNPGALLPQALDSVAALGRADVAHLVVDGASTDGTPDLLRRRAPAWWVSEPDAGIYDAMNKGWAAAPDQAWVLYLGADDRLLALPSAAELDAAEAAGTALLYGDAVIGDAPFRSRFTAELLKANTLHHQALLVHKRVHPAPPFDTRWRVFGDWEFNIRLWKAGVKAAHAPTLRAWAGPGGVSGRRPLAEVYAIVRLHAGPLTALEVCARVSKRKLLAWWRERR